MSLIALLPDDASAGLSPPAGFALLGARWWWLLKRHIAEQHGLPREAAGPRPRSPRELKRDVASISATVFRKAPSRAKPLVCEFGSPNIA